MRPVGSAESNCYTSAESVRLGDSEVHRHNLFGEQVGHLVGGQRPATLYLVVPPSDIARTKPLIRLILNQIGRRLTEALEKEEARRSADPRA